MSPWHSDLHKRKATGGKKRAYRKKRRFERGSFPTETVVDEPRVKLDRRRGGNIKVRLISTRWVNVSDPETGETKKVEILRVIRNPANVDYDRRNVITRGTILETPLGRVRVTSRPGQSGVLNALLISR
ncbi:30S ribosomal protein S8e [Candidatus Bathyarchaeota archaeon]|nr:30S ribosomal protein S8e [Candidatus Bathyarchaeota archaeon]RJS86625.1 MAG: 30S ribosomal protein S8e [Candidatus Bathyarchaeota archaeon]